MKWINNTNLSAAKRAPLPPGYILGRPKGSPAYTSNQLEGMGMTGLYQVSEDAPDLTEFWKAVNRYDEFGLQW